MKTFTAALVVLLALPALAEAKTYTLTGKFPSDAGTISLKVKTNKKGKPVSVSSIKAKNVRYRCPPLNAPEGTPNPEFRRDVTVPGTIKVTTAEANDGVGKDYVFRKSFKLPGQTRNSSVFGIVSKTGKRVSDGDFSLNLTQNGNSCANGLPGFSAKPK
jgi:hypothetical protein